MHGHTNIKFKNIHLVVGVKEAKECSLGRARKGAADLNSITVFILPFTRASAK